MAIHIRLGPRHEKGTGSVQPIKAREVDIAAIHNVEGAWLRQQQIEDMNIVQFTVRDVDETWDAAP